MSHSEYLHVKAQSYLPDFILFSFTELLNARLAIPKLAGAVLVPVARHLEVEDILRPFHRFHNCDIGAVRNFFRGRGSVGDFIGIRGGFRLLRSRRQFLVVQLSVTFIVISLLENKINNATKVCQLILKNTQYTQLL